MRIFTFVCLVALLTHLSFVVAQWFQSGWSADQYQERIPCYGQQMTNGSFHVGRKQYTSEEIYIYHQIFEGYNSKNDLDCTFNGPATGAGNGGMGFGQTLYDWNIDRIDIVSSGGMDCLGGGVGYPWYRFRLYGLSHTEYEASVWVTWRGPGAQLSSNPAYLVRCVYHGTNQVASPVTNAINPYARY